MTYEQSTICCSRLAVGVRFCAMKWMVSVCAGAMCLLAVNAPGEGGSLTREIRYPTRYEAKVGPNGVVMGPSEFKTRETGTRIDVLVAGVAKRVRVKGQSAVELQLEDGRSLTTRTGRMIKLDGKVYRTAGWKGKAYVLVAKRGNDQLHFTLP